MKKIYNAPYLKVVEVKNDIIATSLGDGSPVNNQEGWNENGFDGGYAPGRGIWDDIED